MKHLYTSVDLRMEIMELEAERSRQEQDLREITTAAIHSLNPVNLIKNTFNSTVKSPGFSKALLKGAVGLAAGFLSKKMLVRGSSSVMKKALGTAVELGVVKAVASNAEKIKRTGFKLFGKVFK